MTRSVYKRTPLTCPSCGLVRDYALSIHVITCESPYPNPHVFTCKCGNKINYEYTPNKCEVYLRTKRSELYYIGKQHGVKI